jgi:two-component system, OmpR family, response regulator VicR
MERQQVDGGPEGGTIVSILLVEDEADLSDLMSYLLRRDGHDVIVAHDGETALKLWRERQPELVLLDIGLPRKNGWEVCKTICTESATPVMIVTGADAEEEMVRGLELGAEDYVAKPFSPRMLQARVRVILRRNQSRGDSSIAPSGCLTIGDLSIDGRWRTAICGENSVRLTRLEYRVLQELALLSGQVVPHTDLIQRVWGYKGEASSHVVKGHIRSIRIKLSDISSDSTIRIVPGVGYILEPAV